MIAGFDALGPRQPPTSLQALDTGRYPEDGGWRRCASRASKSDHTAGAGLVYGIRGALGEPQTAPPSEGQSPTDSPEGEVEP